MLINVQEKTKLNDGAIGVLNALKDNYTLHIVSNGFDESQRMKLEGEWHRILL